MVAGQTADAGSEIKFKKRGRPANATRDRSFSREPDSGLEQSTVNTPVESDEEKNIPLDDLMELRKLRRSRQGIDIDKLTKGEVRKRKKGDAEDDGATITPVGLIHPLRKDVPDEEDDKESKARRAVRQSNFTQQTNALDVDKHMMTYIEEHMNKRRGERGEITEQPVPKPYDPHEDLFCLPEKYKTQGTKPVEEGSVTNSLSMLTAIPEVDLGMDIRLKNIEETERAKRAIAESRKEGKRANDGRHLVAPRFYVPNLRQKSDADIIRDAKLEAMGLRPDDHEPRRSERSQTATDEIVMERFKKRMRK